MRNILKCVAVGDGAVGKTSLLMEYSNPGSSATSQYIPSVLDIITQYQMVDGVQFDVGLWEAGGREDYDRLRPLSYPQTDFFLVCFSVCNPYSFTNVKEKWMPELNHHCPDVPKFLVGTKSDVREDEQMLKSIKGKGLDLISTVDAMNLASELGLNGYIETSSYLHQNVDEVFFTAIQYLNGNGKKKNNSGNCMIQ